MTNELSQYAPDAPARDGELTDVQQEICRRIMEGESVRAICRDEAMPSRSAVLNWLASEPTFRMAYGFAKQLLAEQLAEEVIEISDDAGEDFKTRKRDDGTEYEAFDFEHVQRSRLRVDSRKWLAGKLAPKRYGDSSTLRLTDLDDRPRGSMSETEIAVRAASIVESVLRRKGK